MVGQVARRCGREGQPRYSSARARLMVVGVLSCVLLQRGIDGATENRYRDLTPIPLWANKIGPINSPSETFEFFEALPWCRPRILEHRGMNLGQALQGDRLVKTGYLLPFKRSFQRHTLCEKLITPEESSKFVLAIMNMYSYEFFFDDLPLRVFVGEPLTPRNERNESGLGSEHEAAYLYTHMDFSMTYNDDQVISVSVSPGYPVPMDSHPDAPVKIHFTYSARWDPTSIPYSERENQIKNPHHPSDIEIHWYSIANASLIVLLLMAFFGTVMLRLVRKDFAEYQDPEGGGTEFGWKLLHGDVFRSPPRVLLLCSVLGAGVQLLVLCAALLALGVLDIFHPLSRGALLTTAVVLYALTAGIAGYVSASVYAGLHGKRWIRNALLTGFMFGGPVLMVGAFLNSLSLMYGSTKALPVWAVASILALWALVTMPLTIIGAILGRNMTRPVPPLCRVAKIPRDVPPCPWYRRVPFVCLIAGAMPFSSIYLEVYYIFGALWGYKIFAIYEILSIVFVILLIVVTITTTAAVYFQLVVENPHWWWASFLYGGSIGLYMFLFSIAYYKFRSPLEGFLQAAFFFGWMSIASYAFFLMCGSVGFFASRRFVTYMFSSVKVE